MYLPTDKTKQFWSHGFGARIYRMHAGKKFLKMHENVAERIIKRNATAVLDIACGSGDFLLYLATIAPTISLSGSDFAPGMVACAKEKLGDKATIVEAVGGTEPFPEHSFDVITIMMAFHHFPNKLETLIKIKRLLKPNGIIIIADVVAKSDFQKQLWNIIERILNIRGYVDHYTEHDLRKLAKKSGLTFFAMDIPGMPKRYGYHHFESK